MIMSGLDLFSNCSVENFNFRKFKFILGKKFRMTWLNRVLYERFETENFNLIFLVEVRELFASILLLISSWSLFTILDSTLTRERVNKLYAFMTWFVIILQINLDVQQFKPEEVNVKIVDDYLVIEGKHEEKQDQHGYVSRQFTRRYRLPDTIVKENISSTISSDGVLQITAPKKPEAIENQKERQIPITKTNTPAIKQKKDNKGEKMES